MRNRNAIHLQILSLIIVLTFGSWRQADAWQYSRLSRPASYPLGPTLQEEGAPLPTPPLEAITPLTEQSETYIEDRFCGWQAAGLGSGAARLSDELRANWVMVDDNGLLKGQVVGLKPPASENPQPTPDGMSFADGSPVSANVDPSQNRPPQTGMRVFLLQRGLPLASTRIDTQSRFEFQGVKPGNYALIGYGPSGFFAFGFNVLPYAAGRNQPQELYVPAITTTGKPITDWITKNSPEVHFRPFEKLRFGQGVDDPPRLYGIQGLRTFTPEAKPATSIFSHPAYTTVDGRLLGRVHHINSIDGRPLDLRTTKIELVRDGQVAYQTGTDNFGVFEIADVSPGTYELRAAGRDGIGAIQVEVVSGENADAQLIDLALVSSETIGWLNHFAHESAYFAAISGPRDDSECDRCGKRCSRCGGCGCANHACGCGHGDAGSNGYGYGSDGYGSGYDYGGYGFGGNDYPYGGGQYQGYNGSW